MKIHMGWALLVAYVLAVVLSVVVILTVHSPAATMQNTNFDVDQCLYWAGAEHWSKGCGYGRSA